LFFLEARRRTRMRGTPDPRCWRRNLTYLLAIGLPVLLGLGLAVEPAIRVASRVDDGAYGARLIQGNDVALTWAPAGPGWTDSVTWNQIALHGLPPVGFEDKSFGHGGQCNQDSSAGCAGPHDMQGYNVCLFLSEDGSRLATTRQGYWRMPTTDEVVGSLVRHGKNAQCAWNHKTGRQPCAERPDKETPLWRPQSPIIYLWTADEASQEDAYYVTYHGSVYTGPKSSGMGSQGHRCVREAPY
jgi:hypothetical protein